MAKRATAKPAIKSGATTAAKKATPVKRRAAAAKATPTVKSAPAPKQPQVMAAVTVAPAPAAKPGAASPTMKMTRVEFSSKAVAEDYKAMSKAAFDAYVKSGNLFAENFGALNREIMAFAQATMESGLEAARALAAASSLEEMVDLQTKHSQKSVNDFLAESAKLTGLSVELANGSIEPLQNNLKVTVEKLWKPLAA